jgi:4-diphosphocytidyl-2-C-methyl-D-erythritol kinase
MSGSVRVLARAKLNLHLEVGSRRPDGFHDLKSLFQAISLADELHIESVPGDGIAIEGDFGFPPEANIAYAAARLFRERLGERIGLKISIQKRIPMGGGLGGGSSDAAAVLRGLNELLGRPLPAGELGALGATLGSDVPFFLGSPCAWVEGRGERLSAREGRTDLCCAIIEAGFPVSTKEAFGLLDRYRHGSGGSFSAFSFEEAEAMAAYAGPPGKWGFFNSFEGPVFEAYPRLARLKAGLEEGGADFAGMSGSGSTIFGIYGGIGRADAAVERAAAAGLRASRAFLLARGDDIIVK